jgi:hypothetical protein
MLFAAMMARISGDGEVQEMSRVVFVNVSNR